MTIDQLRLAVAAATRRACEDFQSEELATRVTAARFTGCSDDDDALAPARGVILAVIGSAAILTVAFLLVGALA